MKEICRLCNDQPGHYFPPPWPPNIGTTKTSYSFQRNQNADLKVNFNKDIFSWILVSSHIDLFSIIVCFSVLFRVMFIWYKYYRDNVKVHVVWALENIHTFGLGRHFILIFFLNVILYCLHHAYTMLTLKRNMDIIYSINSVLINIFVTKFYNKE